MYKFNQEVCKKVMQIIAVTFLYFSMTGFQLLAVENVPDKTTRSDLKSDQQLKVSGKVIDAAGVPLPGVNVVVKGTTTGVNTDVNGNYSLNLASGNVTLQFSFIGYVTQEIQVGTQTQIDITLEEEATALEEVVVVGYGTQKKINVTGSVVSINTKDIQTLPVSNVTSGLIGRLPGIISVDRGGQPGWSPDISIRGFDNMLVIVDGVQNDYNNIDPNEIESVSILKDASAAIYGARAGNGVMLVTTKRGKSQAPVINFNAYYGLQSPTKPLELVGSPEYATMINDLEAANGRPAKYTAEEIEKYRNGSDPDYPNTNWYREVIRPSAPIAQYNLNTSGGGENVKYFFSLGYLNQGGLFRSGDIGFKRINVRSNIDAKITNSFSASLDLALRDELSYEPGGSMIDIYADLAACQPTYPAHFPDPTKLANTGKVNTHPIGLSTKSFAGYRNDDKKFLDTKLSLLCSMIVCVWNHC